MTRRSEGRRGAGAVITGVIDLLSEDARVPVTGIARELDLPITTAHDYLLLVLSRLEMRAVFSLLREIEGVLQLMLKTPLAN